MAAIRRRRLSRSRTFPAVNTSKKLLSERRRNDKKKIALFWERGSTLIIIGGTAKQMSTTQKSMCQKEIDDKPIFFL